MSQVTCSSRSNLAATNDDKQHHCHVLILPLIDGRMDGSNMLGGKQKLMAMHKRFHLDVAARYGLSKAPARLTGASREAASKAILQRLRETGDSALQSKLWAVVRDKIESDPMAFLMALGIELEAPAMKQKTMAAIFTSKGKGKAKESNPIGFTRQAKEQTLCSVGFTPKPPPPQATKPAPAARQPAPAPKLPTAPLIDSDGVIAEPDGMVHASFTADVPMIETTRVRDSDLDPARFHDGDYCPAPPPPARHQRQAADAWVSAELATRSQPQIRIKG